MIQPQLSPAFMHVSDAPQEWPAAWQVLAIIATATGSVFIRHAERKPSGFSLTVYDADAHRIYRCRLASGMLTTLRGIERRNPGRVHILSGQEFVHPDRQTVCVAASVGASVVRDYGVGLSD